MCGLFAVQSSERLALAEGSKLALVAVGSAAARGVYGLVSNLGGLLVRTLFAPFEEAAFVAFSRCGRRAFDGAGAAADAIHAAHARVAASYVTSCLLSLEVVILL